MGKISAWLANNPWVNVLSILLAFLGIILAILFYVKSKKDKKPKYTLGSSKLIHNFVSKIEGLEIKYGGEPIPNLTSTRVGFWNGGKQTIKRTDIANTDPLLIKVKEGFKILDAGLLYQTHQANHIVINVSEDKSAVGIDFEYLDYLEGGVVQLYHTGTSSEDVALTGTVQGGGNFQRNKIPEIIQDMIILEGKKFRIFAFLFLFLLPPLIGLIAWLTDPKLMVTSLNFLGLIIFILLFWALGYYVFKRRVPKIFDILTIEAS